MVLDPLVDGLVPGAGGDVSLSAPPPYLSPPWCPRAPAGRVVATRSVIRALSAEVLASACACACLPAFVGAPLPQ